MKDMKYNKKEKADMRGLKAFAGFCKPYFPAIIISLICAVTGTVFTIIGPDKLSELTNIITDGVKNSYIYAATGAGESGIDLVKVRNICFLLVAFYGTSAVLSLTQGLIMTNVNQKLSKGLRKSISHKINKLPMGYYNKTSFGDVLSRVTNDVDTLGETVQRSIVSLVSAVTLFAGCLFMMFKTSVVMAIAAIASTLVGFILMSVIMGKSQKYFFKRQEWLGKINGHIEESYSGHDIIRVYNGEDEVCDKFNEMNEELYESDWKSQFLSGLMMPVMGFIGNFGYVAVCVTGAALFMNNKIDMGVIVAFMVYVRLFSSPLSQIAQGMTSLQSAAAASKRVFEFLEAEEMEDESGFTKKLETTTGKVLFEHVKFGYDPDKIIIKDFSEQVNPGEKVAIVGPTGAGKTTLVNLLMKFYPLNDGHIYIDGVKTSELTRENIHNLFGMVLQDTWLFEGTIRENIIYGKENVTDEQLKEACKAVGIHHFIKTLPNGYDTIINDKINLS